jgi:hypothetical protein
MKRQKITVGAILEISIYNEYYTYAQILPNSSIGFIDCKFNKPLTDFSILEQLPVLFILAVYNSAINQGRWLKVGKIPLKIDFLPFKFIQDMHHPNNFELYNPNTGDITPASRDECIGLECAAVWEPEHVESRIRDYNNGVPNIWVKQLAMK